MNNEEEDWRLGTGNPEEMPGVTGGWYDPDFVPRELTFWEKAQRRARKTAIWQFYERCSDTARFFRNWPDDY